MNRMMSDSASTLVSALPFCSHLGMQPAPSGVTLPDTPELTNHIGTVHAGASFTLGEAASGAAAMRDLPQVFGGLAVVKTASIAYKKPAKGAISAKGSLAEPAADLLARLEADGKLSFDVLVSLEDAVGVEVATMTVTWYAKR